RAGLDGRIVGDDDGFAPADAPDTCDDAGGGRLAFVLIVSDQQAGLLEVSVFVEQQLDALARRELAFLMLAGDAVSAAAQAQLVFERFEFIDQTLKVLAVGGGGRSFHSAKSQTEIRKPS